MAMRRLNRRDPWRTRFDRPYHERRYAQPGEFFARPMPGRPPQHYRRLSRVENEPDLAYERRRQGAWEQPGPFTGIGPRDYHLTDEQIHEQVCERLMQHGQVDARHIQVEVSDGEVHLRGAVTSPAERRMAEDALWSIHGVKSVQNLLRVTGESQEQERQSLRIHPPRDWKYKVEIFETKRSIRPATAEDLWAPDRSELTMLEAGLLPVTGAETALDDSPTWTIFTHEEDDLTLDQHEAGFEPYDESAGREAASVRASAEKAISLAAGMEVVDQEGVVVGRVKEMRPDDFLLDRPLARDLYVPYSAVQSTDEHAVLNVRAEEIGNQGWNQPDIL